MTKPGPNTPRPSLLSRKSTLAAAGLAALALAAVLYGSIRPGGKNAPVDPACLGTAQTAKRLHPLVHGEIAALALAAQPKPMPEIAFAAPDGAELRLADFKGRTVLLNLWATWCVPCRLEMPALDNLQGKLGAADFTVVAVNVDTAKLDRPKAFFDETGIKNLTLYADNQAAIVQRLKEAGKVLGLPTTILIGKDGCELGAMAGPAQWDSKDALTLLGAISG
jgi:thiol-disulfide isomerase/thioredoxin